jgi:predicted NAD-dependent protein-ADP-ribosyltransferase YbiA (DUF1768 family)
LPRTSQAAKFNKEAGRSIRQRIQVAVEPQEAMEIAARAQRHCKVEGFQKDEYNLGVMFHITLAKFRQNSKLCKWLLDTDRETNDNPIFHIRDQDSFFGIGEVKEDGMYHGKNWNGVILMIVRSILIQEDCNMRPSLLDEGESAAERFPKDPFPSLGAPADDDRQGREMDRCFKTLLDSIEGVSTEQGWAGGVQFAAALPKGSLIAQRYRVLDVLKTGYIYI